MHFFIWWIRPNKTFWRLNFHWYMFPFHLLQSVSTEFLLMKTHRVLNRSSKCATVRYRKNQVFYGFTINLKSKLLLLTKRLVKKFKKSFVVTLWVGGGRNFHKFFVKNYYYWTWIFFKYSRVLSLRTNLLKKCKPTKKCLT